MVVCIVLLALGAICLTLFILEKIKKYSVRATIIKSVTSLLFISLAAYSFYKNGGHPFGAFAIPALALGLMGDIWLDFKYVYPNDTRIFTFAGFICFAIGHILYITGIMVTLGYPQEWFSYLIPLALGLLSGVLILVLEKPLKYKYGEYKLICFLYGTLLFTTMFTTLYFAIRSGFQLVPINMLFAGALLFAVSDLILCGTYFGEGHEEPFDIASNAITYYAAQFLIAFSLFFLA